MIDAFGGCPFKCIFKIHFFDDIYCKNLVFKKSKKKKYLN